MVGLDVLEGGGLDVEVVLEVVVDVVVVDARPGRCADRPPPDPHATKTTTASAPTFTLVRAVRGAIEHVIVGCVGYLARTGMLRGARNDERARPEPDQPRVRDMAATLAFYRRLALQIHARPDWVAHHVEVELPNGFTLEFDSVEMPQSYDAGWAGRSPGTSGVLDFSLPTRDTVDALHAEMTDAGHPGCQEPYDEPYDAFWGARYAIVEDPDCQQRRTHGPDRPDAARGASRTLSSRGLG